MSNMKFSTQVWGPFVQDRASGLKSFKTSRLAIRDITLDDMSVQAPTPIPYMEGVPEYHREVYLALLSCILDGLEHDPNISFGKMWAQKGLGANRNLKQLLCMEDKYGFLINLKRRIQEHSKNSVTACNLDWLCNNIISRFDFNNTIVREQWLVDLTQI